MRAKDLGLSVKEYNFLIKTLNDEGISLDRIDWASLGKDCSYSIIKDFLYDEYGISLPSYEDESELVTKKQEYKEFFSKYSDKKPVVRFNFGQKFLTPLSSKLKEPHFDNVYGFDIETQNENKEFACGCIVHLVDKPKIFLNIDEMRDFMLNLKKNCIFIATNLEFDATALFGMVKNSNLDLSPFKPFYNKSVLILGRLETKTGHRIRFYDTLNFSRLSVERMGNLLGLPKLERPDFNEGMNNVNRAIWINYNVRDAEISLKFYMLLSKAMYVYGGKIKSTIASSSMDLFRRAFLKGDILRPSLEIINEQRLGYYGGRTEVFKRGWIEDYYMYDVNSMYPYVMLNDYPNPNTIQFTENGKIDNIFSYEGISFVKLIAPIDEYYPLLPCRNKTKLVFSTGKIEGWYSHIEIRNALKNNYELVEIGKQYFYIEVFKPFKEFVERLYAEKLRFKVESNSAMEFFSKILLNSLYGKTAQQTQKVEEIIHIDDLDLSKFDDMFSKWEQIGGYIKISRDMVDKEVPAFVNPIFAIYTTAMARILLYGLIKKSNAIYCDTDSLVTDKKMPVGNEIGELKLEYPIEYGLIIKPKFYFTDKKLRIKGFHKAEIRHLIKILANNRVKYKKFMRFRETLRSIDEGKYGNKIKVVEKFFNCEDDKRKWPGKFNPSELQDSMPLCL